MNQKRGMGGFFAHDAVYLPTPLESKRPSKDYFQALDCIYEKRQQQYKGQEETMPNPWTVFTCVLLCLFRGTLLHFLARFYTKYPPIIPL